MMLLFGTIVAAVMLAPGLREKLDDVSVNVFKRFEIISIEFPDVS